jgi:phage terminase large subunit-like protein
VNYATRAHDYARAVVAGDVPACKWTRLACERHLSDLEKGETDQDYGYYFDDEAANHVCTFIEVLPHVKGRWDSRTIVLEDWQCFILCSVFGWLRKVDSLRKYRTVYIEVPRKNAKSTLTAGVGLYMLGADGEQGAECYSAATTGDQARIVFDVAKGMVRKESRLTSRFGIEAGEHAIYVKRAMSNFVPLNAEGSTLDGLNPHFASVDELHAHKRRDVWDVLETATGSREQPLVWAITTAGVNRSGICYEQQSYVRKLLEGVAENDAYFGIIYTIDDDDVENWMRPECWAKANPNLGISVSLDDLQAKCAKALQMPSAQSNFLTKHLNVWTNADHQWMDMLAWDRCGNSALQESGFSGEECFIGIDLASKVDIAAVLKVFQRDGHYYLFGRYYLPESAVQNGSNAQYDGWARRDLLTVTPGSVIDFETIKDDLRADAKAHQVVEVPFDPWQATQLAGEMLAEQLPMVEYRQTVQNMSEPMKQLEALVLSGKLHHNGDPILTWMVSNVVCHIDAKDNIYPRKERPENKIDGVVAAIMALGRAIVVKEAATMPGIEAWAA